MFKFFCFAIYNINFWFKISKQVKFAQKFPIFLKFLTLEGTLLWTIDIITVFYGVTKYRYNGNCLRLRYL